jgi:hypothetical protein
MATGSKKKNKTVKIRTKGEYRAPVRLRRKGDNPDDTAGDPTNRAYVLKELIPTHKSENRLTCDYADSFDGYPAHWPTKAATVQ